MVTTEQEKLLNEFKEKHNFTDMDLKNLKRYEDTRLSGEMNMMSYLATMKRYNANGGSKLADWIINNYGDYLELLKKLGE
jgi:hypothetical protein